MGVIEIVLISFGLATDAFAASISSGITIHKMRVRHAMLIALFFGGFQAIMPVLGWACGIWAESYIKAVDHWIAFVLLAGLGGKVIWDALQDDDDGEAARDPLNIYVLFVVAIATSIDALAVGVSMSFLGISIITPALIIGVITFITSFAGVYIGDKLGHFFEKRLEIFGGLVLISIGFKILIEHLTLRS
jgi:manganese efflux pump family protein